MNAVQRHTDGMRSAPDLRTDSSSLMTYLNAGVIVLGLLFGFWAEYDIAHEAPAAKPARGIGTSLERWDEAVLLPVDPVAAISRAL